MTQPIHEKDFDRRNKAGFARLIERVFGVRLKDRDRPDGHDTVDFDAYKGRSLVGLAETTCRAKDVFQYPTLQRGRDKINRSIRMAVELGVKWKLFVHWVGRNKFGDHQHPRKGEYGWVEVLPDRRRAFSKEPKWWPEVWVEERRRNDAEWCYDIPLRDFMDFDGSPIEQGPPKVEMRIDEPVIVEPSRRTWVELFGPRPPEPSDWKAEGLRWLTEFNAKRGIVPPVVVAPDPVPEAPPLPDPDDDLPEEGWLF